MSKVPFEETISDDWSRDLEMVEIPLVGRPLFFLGSLLVIVGLVMAGRILFFGTINARVYAERAEDNLNIMTRIPAPRGLILDRGNNVIAENRVVFKALVDSKEFLRRKNLQNKTLTAIESAFGVSREKVISLMRDKNPNLGYVGPVMLASDLSHAEFVRLKSLDLPSVILEFGYARHYPDAYAFASVLGYTGFVDPKNLVKNISLSGQDYVGKAGLELQYDEVLRGKDGFIINYRDARGNSLNKSGRKEPVRGGELKTNLDADLQKYFYERLDKKLKELGRVAGVGMALDPRNGEVLSIISLPSFDGNVFTEGGKSSERIALLNSESLPLFNRAVNGEYSPGSTIKPLIGVAAIKEGVILPKQTIFSPGYLEIPNPYEPDKPTRFPDWQYQGYVNLASAIAQSSNVYFASVGGGTREIRGLGITRIREWWKKFGLGKPTGIDLPAEAYGFLPSPDFKEKKDGAPWLLGDTYNISIGQGDLRLTPIQLLSYIVAIANGGKIYEPHIWSGKPPKVMEDLTYLTPEIEEARKGMIQTVVSPRGSAHTMADLPYEVAGKTGSAQIENNKKENAFFVGFAPASNPQIAILVLVENAKQGSLNALPVAEDVFRWYYENRIMNNEL